MNEAAALGFFISLIGGIIALAYAFVVFLLLLFINSHAKEIRDQVIALNGQLAAVRKELRAQPPSSSL